MIYFIFQTVYFFLMALVLAVLEIQIEGPHGWAAKLPTWRPGLSHWLGRFLHRVTGGEEATGYHLALDAVLLLFFHWPYVWFHTWSLANELYLLGFFVWFTVLWDFLWFVLNPHHSLRDFGPAQATWHKAWVGRVPVKYLVGTAISAGLFLTVGYLGGDITQGVIEFILFFSINALLTVGTIFLYPRTF